MEERKVKYRGRYLPGLRERDVIGPDGYPDRCFIAYYRIEGGDKKLIKEVLGWERKDKMTPRDASQERVLRIKGKAKSNRAVKEENQAREKEQAAKVLFKDYATKWLKVGHGKRGELAYSTKRDYTSAMKLYVIPALGDLPLVDITYEHIEDMRNSLPDELSGKRINNVMVPLKAIFRHAKKNKHITENPAAGLERVKEIPPDIDPFDFLEMLEVKKHAPDHYKALFETMFETGLMASEWIALKWRHIDAKNKWINVREGKVGKNTGPLKTKSRYRSVEIPANDPLLGVLAQHYRDTFNGDIDSYVFVNERGKPINLDGFRKSVWYPTLERAKVRKREIRQTRHTYASLRLTHGEDPAWMQRQLGHSTLNMIFKHYWKYIRSKDRTDGQKYLAEKNKALPANTDVVVGGGI